MLKRKRVTIIQVLLVAITVTYSALRTSQNVDEFIVRSLHDTTVPADMVSTYSTAPYYAVLALLLCILIYQFYAYVWVPEDPKELKREHERIRHTRREPATYEGVGSLRSPRTLKLIAVMVTVLLICLSYIWFTSVI
jgi:hypothetical protein